MDRAGCYRIGFAGNQLSMLIAYRISYGIIAALVLANFLSTHFYEEVPSSIPWLMLACKLSIVAVLLVAALFSRMKISWVWGVLTIWECLFVWYAWISPGAPFKLYLPRVWAVVLFVGLSLWFLSMGLVRSLNPGIHEAKARNRILSRS